MTTEALTIYQNIKDPIKDCEAMGDKICKSGMFGVDSQAQGFIVAFNCVAMGISLMEYDATYHTIKGKRSMRADAMHAKFLQAGGTLDWIETTDKACEARFYHPVHAKKGYTQRITIDQIPAYLKNKSAVWQSWPARMLQCRVISMGIKAIAPFINYGQYTEAEGEAFGDSIKTSCEVIQPDAVIDDIENFEVGQPLALTGHDETVDIANTPAEKISVENPNPDPPAKDGGLSSPARAAIDWVGTFFIPGPPGNDRKMLEDYVGRKLSVNTIPAPMWKENEMPILRQLRDYIVSIKDSAERQQALEKALVVSSE